MLQLLAQLQLKNRGNDNHRLVTRIAKARINNGLSITEICKLTGLSYDNYIKYERDEVKDQYKNFDTLKKISDVLNINLMNDYLSFKTHSKEKVCSYMELHNLSIRKLAKICNVSITTKKTGVMESVLPPMRCGREYLNNRLYNL